MKTETSRRGFIAGSLSLGALASGCLTRPLFGKRWYKGNLHMHTFWSDGRAFPEEAVMWYKSHGYDFIGISDHNIFQENPRKYIGVADPEKKIPGAQKKYVDKYLAAYPNAEVRTGEDGRMEIRLKTFAELSRDYASPGSFLLIPNVEATRHTQLPDKRVHQLHMNYVNLPGLLPSYKSKDFKWGLKDGTGVSEFLARNARETSEFAKTMGRKHLFILNHPVWTWYDVGPEALIDNPEVLFFELCNNGSPFAPGKDLPTDGFDTDRLWDVVNAFRARRKQKLLYGIGTDDTHYYCDEKSDMVKPGNAWTLVRADALTADAIIDAMYEGDFVTCEMLEFSDVHFDRSARRLEVSVDAKTAVARTVKFIVTKKDFSEKPVKTLTVRPKGQNDSNARYERTINIYDEKIGMVAKTVKGGVGEAISASYVMQSDDLYVRARVEESGQPICTAHLHPQGKHVAWTQPYL